MPIELPARWIRVIDRAPTANNCRYCLRFQSYDCEPVACMACGSIQCHGNGSGNGCCSVCFYGYLPKWGRNAVERVCGYVRCGNEAVARGSRVGPVCFDHMARAKADKTRTYAEYIAHRIAYRDSGGNGWDRWRLVA